MLELYHLVNSRREFRRLLGLILLRRRILLMGLGLSKVRPRLRCLVGFENGGAWWREVVVVLGMRRLVYFLIVYLMRLGLELLMDDVIQRIALVLVYLYLYHEKKDPDH